jgi:hypothetical protein
MGRTYGLAESAADLAIYREYKRTVALRSVLVAAPVALALVLWSAHSALALGVGAVCGIANLFLGTYGNERLVEVRNVGFFVLSSFLRIGLFGIVAAALAIWGPWWLLGPYFAGLFLPLATYALGVTRAFDASKRK